MASTLVPLPAGTFAVLLTAHTILGQQTLLSYYHSTHHPHHFRQTWYKDTNLIFCALGLEMTLPLPLGWWVSNCAPPNQLMKKTAPTWPSA